MITQSGWCKALKNKIILPSHVPLGSLIAVFSPDYYMNYWREEGSTRKKTVGQFWLWSTPRDMQSWMYNHEGKIYLEIGKAYVIPEHQELSNDDDFQNYIAHYKPLLFAKITPAIAQNWLEKCKKIILEIDSAYELTV